MSTLAPYEVNVPGTKDWQPMLDRSEQSSLHYWMGLILGRGWRAALVGVVIFGVVVGFASTLPRTYYAEGSVLVQPSHNNLAEGTQNQSMQPIDTGAVDTEVEMLKSRALSETVIEKLGLLKDPEFNPPPASTWHVGFTDQFPFIGISSQVKDVSPEEMLRKTVDAVQRGTFARRIGLTDVVRVGFSSTDAIKAQTIANGLIDAYLARQVTDKVNLVNKANDELTASVDKLREDALTSAAAAEQYKNSHSILSPQGASMVEAEIATLNQQIAQAHADRIQKESQISNAMALGGKNGDGGDTAEALNSDTIRELRKQEADISAQVAQLSTQFKPDYPETKRAQAQLNDVRGQIRGELNRIRSSLTASVRGAAQREDSLVASRQQAQQTLDTNNAARVALVSLELKADASKKTYEGYLNRASDVAAARSLQQPDAMVNYKAAVASDTPSPNMRLVMAGAAILALLGAALAVIIPEYWNRRFRSSSDVELGIGLPLAATLPDITSLGQSRRLRGPAAPAISLMTDRFTAFAESFRNLRAFLALLDPSEPSKVIALTSSVPREGKSVTSLCLAEILAQAGESVVVVDCDVRRHGLTSLVSEAANAQVGIVEAMKKNLPLNDVLVLDPRSGAWVLPVAHHEGVPEDLFSTKQWDALVRSLAQRFDHVILDTPPLLGVADSRILCTKADKVLFIVRWNKTPMSAVQAAADILQQCGAKVAGAVLSQVNIRQQARFGYGDSSDYFGSYKNYYLTNS
ncbi:MAG TPA: AAA family ATPase [Stellaceae bacterium]|jgi:capsular exopolysaccharide synthesis family protein|nr:AAA family ATPase [Stellaceae bacterium]